jgi:hypothetical protein
MELALSINDTTLGGVGDLCMSLEVFGRVEDARDRCGLGPGCPVWNGVQIFAHSWTTGGLNGCLIGESVSGSGWWSAELILCFNSVLLSGDHASSMTTGEVDLANRVKDTRGLGSRLSKNDDGKVSGSWVTTGPRLVFKEDTISISSNRGSLDTSRLRPRGD